jgi:hypothetical protein
MNRGRVRAWSELTLGCALLACAPTKPVDDRELPEKELLEPTQILTCSAPGSEPAVEPAHRAVSGFLRITRVGGAATEHYVGRHPDYIADQLRAAVVSRRPLYRYWDMPGFADAKLVEIATPIVESVSVRYLEADLDALYENQAAWVL